MKHETYDEFLTDAKRGRVLTNSIGKAPMTRTRLQSLILQGFGQGRGDDYQPWITVTRGNAPRASNHIVAIGSIGSRPMHFLSTLEYRAGRVANWLGALEIRTQFPLFPWRGHPHPMAGLEQGYDACLPVMPGLLEIASEAGISHGTYVGSPELPYVATSDLVVRFGPASTQKLTFWTVKPAGALRAERPGSRMRQRIDLERLYAEKAGGRHVLFDGEQFSDILTANLDWLEPTRHERTDAEEIERRSRFVHAFNSHPDGVALRDRISSASAAIGAEVVDGQRFFRAAAWLTEIDIDLRARVLMSAPMRSGGKAHKQVVFQQIAGEKQ
ncbi:TnsA endonuclease N-terminal domain-containing protein [Rubrivivax albus]|uniref:Uncharacterized protein n=1 Tax=Rubrivivax albus TaxID=2499835 RepID=A0A437JMU7_9BURK|nr:TnsA endonuclease N-terminal domain-containing protein [Rubrivivax albus]RVT48120.1 hypothetical protein ENE75_23315 [Rubrivivax albus]